MTDRYTAHQIAIALGRTDRAVRLRLDTIPPTGQQETAGTPANAWSLASLPLDWRATLADRARTLGHRDVVHLLQDPAPTPGRPATERLADWPSPTIFRELADQISALKPGNPPSLDDKAYVLDAAFQQFERIEGTRGLKRAFLRFLRACVPGLSTSDAGLAKLFDREFAHWTKNGKTVVCLRDQRAGNSGRPARRLCPQCVKLVAGGALSLDGDESQAWRRLLQSGKLCPECAARFTFNPAAKSYVPETVRRQVTPMVETALPYRRGPKFARLTGPYIRRVHSDYGPGDYLVADDWTPNTNFYDCDETGRFHMTRGECLTIVDERTLYPVAFLLIGAPILEDGETGRASYHSGHVRSLILRAHDTVGLPHTGLTLEGGVWKARLIDGPRRKGAVWNPWRSVETGLRHPALGLRIRHTTAGRPQGKAGLEGLFGIIQDRLRCAPGFVGFNERADKREGSADFMQRVRTGKEHPGNQLPSMREWEQVISTTLMEYASDIQNGSMLPNRSPADAFQNGIDGHPGILAKPLRKLTPESRHLLSTHTIEKEVTAQGIRLAFGNRSFEYWGADLAPFRGRRVLCHFNLEEPAVLVVSDLDRKEFVTVKCQTLPAKTATREQFKEANRDRAAFMRPGKVLFGELPHPFASNITRDNEHSEDLKRTGRAVNEAVEAHRQEEADTRRQARKDRQLAGALGAVIPDDAPARVVKPSLEWEDDVLARAQAAQAARTGQTDSAL